MMNTLLLKMYATPTQLLINTKISPLQVVGSTSFVKIKTSMNWILSLLPTLNFQGERGIPGQQGMPGQPGRSISGPKVNK